MKRSKRLYIVGGLLAVIALAAIGGGIAIATGAGDNDQPITGAALDKANAAALAQTGGGTVTQTEVGDEEGYYQVEVTLDDGSQVDVNLDKDFNVIAQSADDDNHNDQDGSDGN